MRGSVFIATRRKPFDKYGSNIFSGSRSVYDSMTDAMRYDFGAEYFLSPSGVVDLGTVRTPSSFNSDGTVKVTGKSSTEGSRY